MKNHGHKLVPLGALVACIYDAVALYSDNPAEVSLMANRVVAMMLEKTRKSLTLSRVSGAASESSRATQ
jgi:hypothetical protein